MNQRQQFENRVAAEVEMFLRQQNCWWRWNNHANLAELSSGAASDFYVNCSPLFTKPHLQDQIGAAMAGHVHLSNPPPANLWVVGAAFGGIGLAQSVSRIFAASGCKAAYAEKDPANLGKNGMSIARFNLGHRPYVILVEDVVTTGGTFQQVMASIRRVYAGSNNQPVFHPEVLAIVNRSGKKEIHGFQVKALRDIEASIWFSDEERPAHLRGLGTVYPKRNWDLLQQKRKSSIELAS